MAKKNYITKKTLPEPVEEPWIVVHAPGTPQAGRPVYLQSELGITRQRAESLAQRLRGAVAVPR